MTELKTADMKEYGRQYHLKNREKIAAQNREYQKANRERIAAQQREYRMANDKCDYMNGRLDPKSPPGKGFIAEMVVAKALGLESGARCNCTANFAYKYDLLDSGGYGEINVKSAKLLTGGRWDFNLRNMYKPDTYVFVAYNKDHIDIAHVWIVPANAAIVSDIKSLGISNSEKGLSRIQEFEVSNTMYNVYLHTMSIDRCSVLKSSDSISDIVAGVLG